ncbi:competence protein ComQ [Paenibacillus sp. UNCCL117]|uniref:polyprenyl synthetase family protein n=1 Tax=unclassified Paenibacillus TaxID=185978 RepID=UPI000891188F|nr:MULTISPECIES: polyprenyl synthetase family protein [unclassified Paenibacillus]SDC06729.1 competence protein ComQ [Paenibacillus sp. cl123]SFW37886.1 competence protein ComQ [Paenibacillus sp. UNCCL117]
MNPDIRRQMCRIVDDYITVEELGALLKAFIADKALEYGTWSDMTICTHYMLGGSSPHIERLAAVTELIVLTLDIVDDLQDQDQGGKPWMQCPQAVALNAVLALLLGAIGELGRLQVRPEALTELALLLTRSVNGQQKDVSGALTTPDDYIAMTQEKSGSLFRLACFMGHSALNAAPATIERLHQLADCAGLIHQIQNDMRDLISFDIKSDLLGRKRTLPVLYLLQVEEEAFRPFKDYYEGRLDADWLLAHKEELVHTIRHSGCIEYAGVVQSICVQKAQEIYAGIEAASPWKEKLKAAMLGSFLDEEQAESTA